jgi:outer membrane protein assembly factor BamA/autotransporter translocation and assembly factor TamB
MRRTVRIVAACLALLAVAVLLAHAPPVRRFVLSRAAIALEQRMGLALRARSLSYNLLTFRASLTDVSLASVTSRDTPLFAADRVEVSIPRAILFGPLSIERLRIDNARVTILRRADGTTNLPPAGDDGGEPQRLPIRQIEIPRLGVTVTDQQNDVSLALPGLAVHVGATEGTLRLAGDGAIRRGGVTTAITALGGGVTFDGRAIGVSRFALTTGEVGVVIDGGMTLLVAEPLLDVRMSGRADVPALARWVSPGPGAAGTVTFEGTLAGPFGSPEAKLRLRSDRLAWNGAAVSDATAEVAVNLDRIDVSALAASFAGGRITGGGSHAFATASSALTASWSSLRLDALQAALLPASTPRIAGAASGSATAQMTGTDPATLTIDARTEVDGQAARPGQLAAPGRTSVRVANGRWQLEGNHLVGAAPVTIAARGVVDPASLMDSTLGGTVALRDVDLPIMLRAWRYAGVLDIAEDVLTSGRLEATTVLSGTLARPRFEITAAGRSLAAQGVSNVDVDLNATGTIEQLAIEARAHQLDANVVTASGAWWPRAARIQASIAGTLADPAALLPAIPIAGAIDLRFDASGPLAAIEGTGTLTARDVTYDRFRIGQAEATVVVDPGLVTTDAVAPELGARAHAAVGLTGARRATFDLSLENADVSRWLASAAPGVEATGRIGLTVRGEAPRTDWRDGFADLVATVLDVSVGDVPVRLTEPARVSYRGRALDVAGIDAAVGETRLSVRGRLPAFASTTPAVTSDALLATLTGDVGDVLRTARAAGLEAASGLSAQGPVTLLARLAGSAERPIVTADLELGPAELAVDMLPPVRALELRARVAGGWLESVTASAEWQQALVSGEARIPLRFLEGHVPTGVIAALPPTTEPASASLRVLSITPALLSSVLEPDMLAQVEGVVEASARLRASSPRIDDLAGDVTIDRLDVRVAGLPVAQREPTRLAIAQGIARIAGWDWAGQGATLGVQGQVRLSDREAAILAAGRLDLRMLTPFVRDAGLTLGGTLVPRLAVAGPLDAPRIDGEIALSGGDVRLREPRIVATEITAGAVFSPTGGRITSLAGAINGGTLKGSGELGYGAGRPTTLRLSGVFAGVGLEFPEGLRSELDADLMLALEQGDGPATGAITGAVTVLRSAYRQPLPVVTGLMRALRTARLAAVAGDDDSLASRLTLDVRIVTDEDVAVDNNLARLQLGGDLRAIGTVALPSLAGRALLREGGQLFLGSNVYTVESGTIDFTNPDAIEPDMNVQAGTRAGGHEIELTLAGTPETLDVSLRSATNPDLGQADVASLLLTGRVLEDVPGAEGRIVGEQVLSYLSGDILGVASRTVGLDTIRLGGVDGATLRQDPAAIAAEADPTSRLTFGKSFGNKVEVTYSQSLRDGDAQTWIVDYRPLSQLGLRFVSRDDSLRSYELRHDVSLGGAGAAPRPASRETVDVRVAGVTFTGDAGLPEASLRAVLSVQPGDRFDFSEWQRDRDRLEELLRRQGRLEARVAARREERDASIFLAYDIDAGPRTALRVDGYQPKREVLERLETAWTQSVYDGFLQEEAEAIVRAALAEDGYLHPAVSSAIATGEAKTLSLTILPGDRATDRRLDVDAGDEALSLELGLWLRTRGLDAMAWSDPDAIEAALIDELRARGYLNARVVVAPPPEGVVAAATTVAVTPGARFFVRDVRFVGGGRLDAAAVTGATMPVAPGVPYDPAAVEAGRDRIVRVYRREGFPDVQVKADAAVAAADPEVAVVYTIAEGPRRTLGEVVIRGNRNTDADVIARAIGLTVGEPLGADAWLDARARLFDTALFQRVDVAVEPGAPATGDAAERPASVIATVQEWPALRVRYGLQLAEERPPDDIEGRNVTPGLSLDVTRRTLFGRALTLGVVADYHRRDQRARTFVNAPTMFGWPVESLLSLERARESFADATLVTDRSGISWEQRVRVSRNIRLSYSYRFDRDHTFDTNPDRDPLTPAFDVTVNIARLTGTAVLDTRNDPLDTTRGWLLSSSLEYAPATLGSQFRFLRHAGQAYFYQPWRGMVLASAARLGLVTPLGGQTLIPSERFFSGGARSVRGLPEDGLGARDLFGDPAGGRAMLVLNQEVRFPVYRWVRGAGFVDAGNVFESPGAIDVGQLTGSIGAGVRVMTPFALLRADYARLWSGPLAGAGRWTFGIGQAF